MPPPTVPGTHGQRVQAARPKGRASGRGTAPDARRPPKRWKTQPPGRPSTTLRCNAAPLRGMHAKGTVPGPHAGTPAPTARGRQTQTARPEDKQQEDDDRLTSDAPHNGAWRPPGECRPATPTARNASLHERTQWVPHHRCPGHTGNGPRMPFPPRGTGSRGRDSA